MAWTAEQMAQKRAKLQKKNNAAAGGAEPLSQRKSADSPLNRATTTAASGGLREELLGPRPARHKHNTLCEVDAGSRNPIALLRCIPPGPAAHAVPGIICLEVFYDSW